MQVTLQEQQSPWSPLTGGRNVPRIVFAKTLDNVLCRADVEQLIDLTLEHVNAVHSRRSYAPKSLLRNTPGHEAVNRNL